MTNLAEYKSFAKRLANKSGEIIKSYFRTEIIVDSKTDDSPVTIADKLAEEVMRGMIMSEYPKHGILGEEFGEHNPDAEYKWILDPIDGTKSFICGSVMFGTLIALLKNGKPIIGVINQPILNEFLIGDNDTALLNGREVKVRQCTNLHEAVLVTGDYLNVIKYQNGKKFNSLIKKVKLYRGWGDCYAYYLLASGFVDVVLDPIMSPWDTLALIPIIQGAGGVITDYQGNDPVTGNSVIASTPGIHSEVIKALN